MTQTLQPARVFPPGRVISEELEERDWTQKDLAEIMGRPAQTINEIVKGTKQITPETAIELSEAFGTSAEFWTNLETNYQLFLARQTKPDKPIARKSKIYEVAPIAEMIKLGWLQKNQSVDVLEQQVCDFFGISEIDETPQLAINLRCSQYRTPKAASQVTWARRVENLVKQQDIPLYNRAKLIQAIPELAKMSVLSTNVTLIPDFLMNLGVRFAIVPHLSKTYLDGGALHLDNRIDQPVIALTLRYGRIDSFWFTLMHEIAHIVLEHEGNILDSLDDGSTDDKEIEANQVASDWLIEPSVYERFLDGSQVKFSEESIIRFASEQYRHPGILIGRLHKESKIPYTHFKKHLVTIKNELQDWVDVPFRNSSKSVPDLLKRSQNRRNSRQVPPPELDSTCMIQEDRNR